MMRMTLYQCKLITWHNALMAVAAILLFSGCTLTRNLDQDQYLLKKNTIRVETTDDPMNFSSGDLDRFMQQKPNKRVFRVVPFHAATYNFAQGINMADSSGFSPARQWMWRRKDGFRAWLMKNGEAPVVLDSNLTNRSVAQLESFLFTRGHFSGVVSKSIDTLRSQKAVVLYTVFPGPGHSIRKISTEIPSHRVRDLWNSTASQSLIREGAPYNERAFQQERDRITRVLKEHGFYHFNKAYIIFDVDTFVEGNLLDVYMRILDQSFFEDEQKELVVTRPHLPSRIRHVFINPEFEGVFVQRNQQIVPLESVSKRHDQSVTYYLYSSGVQPLNPQVLLRNIMLEPGQRYNLRDVELTYLYLTDLGNFSNVSISFTDVDSSYIDSDSILWIDAHINMMPLHRQLYEVRLDATNRAGDPGISSYLVYQNRNMFKGAEVMSLALKGALEVQKILDKDQVETTIFDQLPFNTLELGVDLDFRIPRFIAPFRLQWIENAYRPRSRFSGGVNYQERPDFRRYVIKVVSGYEWQLSPQLLMGFNPLEVNAVSIFPSPSFIAKIEALNDQRLRNSYSDHIITALSWNMVLDKQGSRTRKTYSYLRLYFESAGLLLNAFKNPFNYPLNDNGVHTVFNIPYAQYLRADVDYRQFFRLKQKDQLIAARFYLGLGNPYGNMDVLPFEKGFYVGGANGIRAWAVRTIGPGSFSDQNNLIRFDRTGDFGFESSLEYRFPMYGTFHGAAFLDAGNVWLKNKNEKYPGGEFIPSHLFRELAVGTGVGLRIVTFFVIRVDAGIKIHDPSKPEGERWVIEDFRPRKINWNLGIGYSI